ncbi:MAG: GNAT family N-acetyltransferase [Solirubrobacterales bacterium]
MSEPVVVRAARPDDAEAIARIHNEGIAERVATFQTAIQQGPDIAEAIEGGRLVFVAARGHEVVGWASVAPYDDAHEYYSGVGEATLYVRSQARREGTGRALLAALAEEAERRGYHKLVGKIFTTNGPSIALVRASGWREVGLHERHGRLDGEWRDVLVVEMLLGEARSEG